MKKFMLMSVFAVSLFLVSCESDILNEASEANTTENDDISSRSARSNRDGVECPASYITLIPCDDKFNIQLHYGPGGTGGISNWCFNYELKNAAGVVIDSGTTTNGGSTNPSPLVTPCQNYTIECTGCCGSIYPFSTALIGDGCGGTYNC